MSVRILEGDALAVLRTLESESVQCLCTSPPYFNLRDYQVAGQIGLEATPAEFIAVLVAVFDEVRRVLRPDGVCFVNLGDSYAGSRGNGWQQTMHEQNRTTGISGNVALHTLTGRSDDGIPAKNLLLIPERFALAMQGFSAVPGAGLLQMADELASAREADDWQMVEAVESQLRVWAAWSRVFDGWWVRSRIAWCKTSAMPESTRDRPTSAWEHIYMFTKSARYFWDGDAVRTPITSPSPHFRSGTYTGGNIDNSNGKPGRFHKGEPNAAGANLRNFWLLGPEPSSLNHYASFVSEIPRRCIKAATSQAGACPACGAPWIRSNNQEKRYNRGNGNVPLQQVSGDAAARVIREGQPEGGRPAADVPGVRRGDQTRELASGPEQDVRTGQAIPREERREDQRAETSLSADGAWPRADAGTLQGLQANGTGQGVRAGRPESIRQDGAGQARESHQRQPSQSVTPQRPGGIYGSGLAADADSAAEPLFLLQEEVYEEAAGDDRPCDPAKQGRSAQSGEHRRSVPAVQLGQVEQDRLPALTGWQPSCTCDAGPPRPCVVLDPFAGSGTTGLVASQLGRSAILIELSPVYARMAEKRLAGDAPMFTADEVTVERADAYQPDLFAEVS